MTKEVNFMDRIVPVVVINDVSEVESKLGVKL